MKAALLYGSSYGKTRKVIAEFLARLCLRPEVFDVKLRPTADKLAAYELFMFFAPTYGDEELQDDMEDFIVRSGFDPAGKHFVICELGNYYGYDNYAFGAMPILRKWLLQNNGREFFTPLSLDSYPKVHWEHLRDWTNQLNNRLEQDV